MSTAVATTSPQHDRIDPRGPQFAASVTALVLVAVLLTAPHQVGLLLLAGQAALFALGLALGVRRGPWAVVFRRLVRPRLSAPSYLEDAAPPRFAQGVGLVFALVALTGYLSGVVVLGAVAAGLALVAALLNAVFRFCLGCEMYLLILRARRSRGGARLLGAAEAFASAKQPNISVESDPTLHSNEKVTA